MLAPLTLEVPVTASVGVALPERTTPLTLVGVMPSREREIAGVVVAVATEPETPFAVVTDTLVTVPAPSPSEPPAARVLTTTVMKLSKD